MATSVYTSQLVKDYKRKSGETKALRKELRETSKVVLAKEAELAALELIIKSREPAFDLQSVEPVATFPKVLPLKWGQLTALILSCLREADGTPVSTDVIVDYVAINGNLDISHRANHLLIRLSVQKRLKALTSEGRSIRHHSKKFNAYGMWSLPRRK